MVQCVIPNALLTNLEKQIPSHNLLCTWHINMQKLALIDVDAIKTVAGSELGIESGLLQSNKELYTVSVLSLHVRARRCNMRHLPTSGNHGTLH